MTFQSIVHAVARLLIVSLLVGFVCTAGCSTGFKRVDQNVDRLIADTTGDLRGSVTPSISRLHEHPTHLDRSRNPTDQYLPTTNPSADELDYIARLEADQINARLYDEAVDPEDVLRLDLNRSLTYAMRHSREYRFEEEEYVLAALRLLIERHLWGPRFFNDTSAAISGSGDDGFFETAARLVNEFSVTQRLPYGGQVAVSALARASEDLHRRVSTQGRQSADLILSAQVPLLRGAGNVAREGRIQAERNLIYQARDFEQFRREFLFEIAREFLGIVVQLQGIENAERSVESFTWLEQRARAFVESGRETPIDLAQAEQATLFAQDALIVQQEAYRLALDRFKLRLSIPTDQYVEIVRSDPGLPAPEVSLDDAVARAMAYRLDLQTRRDQLDDARRRVDNARNALLPDLNISGFVGVGTDENKRRGGLGFQPENADFEAGVTFGLPLDREIERINVRQAQISLERAARDYQRFRDQLAVDTRSAVRNIERATFSLRIQEENVRIAERGQEAIEADPDRATARDRTDAVDRLLRARDQRDRAHRDLQVAILQYLLFSGQLRVLPDGTIDPLRGMEFADSAPNAVEAPQGPAGG